MSNDLAIGDDSDLLLGDDDDMGDDPGSDLLLGDDDEEIVGGRRRNKKKKRRLKYYQPGDQTQVLPFPRGEGGAASVLAGALATVFARPQRPFQTQRFVWPSTTSPFFVINQFSIGQESMFVQAGSVAVEIFSQTGVGVALRGYIARPGIDITLQVTNTDVAPHPIEAAIIGATLI